MATAEGARRRRLPWGPALALAVAASIGVAALVRDDASPEAEAGADVAAGAPAPVPVSAVEDGPANAAGVASAADLAGAADLVVRGRVLSVARGRVFGSGDTAIVSRLVTVAVEDVLAGPAPGVPTLLVEEEGWLADGRELAVNGLAPSRVDLDAVWFLEEVPDPDLPVWVVVGTRGRYSVEGDALVGPEGDDPLVSEVESLGLRGLQAALHLPG